MLLMGVQAYRYFISPIKQYFFGPGSGCRFYPSCSEYAMDAFTHVGPIKGGLLTIFRILKCHPWHPGGYDPVPVKNNLKSNHG